MYTADSKPVKQEVNCIVILPPLVFPGQSVLVGARLDKDEKTLASFAHSWVMKKKSFIALAPGVNVSKPFFTSS